jgi:hypothetical protein
MPGQRTDWYWREQVKLITAENPRLGAVPVTKLLEQQAEALGRNDVPSWRTVLRIQQGIRGSPEEAEYRSVKWPEVCELGEPGGLPWEASGAVLELLRYLENTGSGRPSVSLARAYWRITLARPDITAEQKFEAARSLLWCKVLQDPKTNRQLEALLAIEGDLGDPSMFTIEAPTGVTETGLASELKLVKGLARKPYGPPDWDLMFSKREGSES